MQFQPHRPYLKVLVSGVPERATKWARVGRNPTLDESTESLLVSSNMVRIMEKES
jgi:hypothetical protein